MSDYFYSFEYQMINLGMGVKEAAWSVKYWWPIIREQLADEENQ